MHTMNLVQIRLRIDFDKKTVLRTPAHKVFDALGGKLKGGGGPIEPAADIKFEDIKTAVKWDYDSCKIVIEQDYEQYEQYQDALMKLLLMIDSAAPIGRMQSILLDTNWMLPVTLADYASLNALYKQKMIIHHDFMNDASDSSVILDFAMGDYILHHQSGPMQSEQLRNDWLMFSRKDLPKLFMFLNVAIKQIKVVDYSKKEMGNFFKTAFAHCRSHSEGFGSIWEVVNE